LFDRQIGEPLVRLHVSDRLIEFAGIEPDQDVWDLALLELLS